MIPLEPKRVAWVEALKYFDGYERGSVYLVLVTEQIASLIVDGYFRLIEDAHGSQGQD